MSYKTAPRPALLTAAEERQLADQIHLGRLAESRRSEAETAGVDPVDGDELVIRRGREARRRFMEANVGLVLSIASKMRAPNHVDRQDMVQDGMLGLERAIDKFDGRKGYKFSTYATWWIRQSIQRGLEHTTGSIRIPTHRASELNVALAACDGDYSKLSPMLATVAARANVASLDRPVLEGAGSLGDVVADDTGDPGLVVTDSAERVAVLRLLGQLDHSTRRAIVRRFGLDGTEPATYAEIGSELGVGGEAVRRRILRALGQMRAPAQRVVA